MPYDISLIQIIFFYLLCAFFIFFVKNTVFIIIKSRIRCRFFKRNDLFPTHRFRMADDQLQRRSPQRAAKEYLRILHLAARVNETAVDTALHHLIDQDQAITAESVEALVYVETQQLFSPENVVVNEVDLAAYDDLFRDSGSLIHVGEAVQ